MAPKQRMSTKLHYVQGYGFALGTKPLNLDGDGPLTDDKKLLCDTFNELARRAEAQPSKPEPAEPLPFLDALSTLPRRTFAFDKAPEAGAVDLPRDFRYECVITVRFGEWERRYRVEGRDGACEFYVRTTPKRVMGPASEADEVAANESEYYGGFELHRAIPNGMDGPPDHGRCSALSDRACWHDGSSLYASEVWIPQWRRDPENHEAVFRALVHEYRERFKKEDAS